MVDFGTDLSCVTDLTTDCAEVSGALCWLQSLARRLQVPLGGLFYDPDYGYDLTGKLDDEIAIADLTSIAADIDNEFLKDEQTLSSSTTVVSTVNNGAVTLKTTSKVSSAAGPFTLVLSVTNVTVKILQITPG